MFIIENKHTKVAISACGAELMSIFNKQNQLEYLWQGNPKYWSRRAPILFPIVGKLKNDAYAYKGHEYHIKQHGFARDMIFEVVEKLSETITFFCRSNNFTRSSFPFDWLLEIKYTIKINTLIVTAMVKNKSYTNSMLFSIGFHPAFNVPLIKEKEMHEDYCLYFNDDIKGDRWMINNGLIDTIRKPAFELGRIPLSVDLFKDDALVFKNLKSDTITLQSMSTKTGLNFRFNSCPYLGIWSKYEAPFVCIEPWWGIADAVNHDGNFESKEGIITLESGHSFSCGYEVELF
ncbi:MAG: aldose 1-epimerase family protein [Saprospiraceae bacterium]|nr:aldose 1-epimerase family protein [Saprospiraceae bacterium]